MVRFLAQQRVFGWDKKLMVPISLQSQVREIQQLMHTWKGRKILGRVPVRDLHSDSSNFAWAGVDPQKGLLVQDYWRDQQGLHNNVKELKAAIFTVMSLVKKGEK